MIRVDEIRDRDRIESFLRRDVASHVYPLGDLDDLFWDSTRWFAALEQGEIRALALLLVGLQEPIFYAVAPWRDPATRTLVSQVQSELPDRFFYNLAPELEDTLLPSWELSPHGLYWKMSLGDASLVERVDTTRCVPLTTGDLPEIRSFLEGAYLPSETGGAFFESVMVEPGFYRGLRRDGSLVAMAGLHVFSERYGVSALGNVVTHPQARGQGIARLLTAAVCQALGRHVPTIGLNVLCENSAAIRCYRSLGFRTVRSYEEGIATRR